jgi:hypothetical protein
MTDHHSSYDIQDMLFLRNNTPIKSFKLQIGLGVGFEESKWWLVSIQNATSYVYVYLPL